MQALVKNIFQRHREWQEDRRTELQPGLFRNNTAFIASLDVKTESDVTKPSVVSKILSLTGVHGHLTGALLAENAGCSGVSVLRTWRDGVQVFEVYSSR